MCLRGLQIVLPLLIFPSAFEAATTQVRTYRMREPHDRGVLFTMTVTPQQDVLSLVPKRNGTWRLTRVRNWLDAEPLEQTIDIPGIAVPLRTADSDRRVSTLQMRLIVTSDGSFAITIADGTWRNRTGYATSNDDVVSVIDLHSFRVVKNIQGPVLSMEPAHGRDGAIRVREYAVDAENLLVRTTTSLRDPVSYCDNATQQTLRVSTTEFDGNRSEVDLRFLTLPDLADTGECHFREKRTCGAKTTEDPSGSCAELLRRKQGKPVPLADFLNLFSDLYQLRMKDPLEHHCPTTGITRDGRFEKESCFGFPTRTFWGNTGKPSDY